MTFPRYLSLVKYWDDHPPAHLLIAAQVGYKNTEKASFGDFIKDFGNGAY